MHHRFAKGYTNLDLEPAHKKLHRLFSGVVSINYKAPTECLEEPAAIMRMLIKAQISLTYVTGGCVTSRGVYARHALSILQTVFGQKIYTQS